VHTDKLFGAGIAVHLRGLLVTQNHLPIQVRHGDGIRRDLDQGAITFLALAQGLRPFFDLALQPGVQRVQLSDALPEPALRHFERCKALG